MAIQYLITGIINSTDAIHHPGIKVKVFNRDLPSIEGRLRIDQQLLGEATTNIEGRFTITYAPKQVSINTGIDHTLTTSKKQNADLSFRVFDQSGQKLSIRNIEALNRSFGPDQIIFNAPGEMEISIFIEPGLKGTEYENLHAMIAPVMGEVTLAELTDEDVVFLLRSSGIEQSTEQQQRVQWLQRSALLAKQSGLPTHLFYGWGRVNIPDPIAILAATPVTALQPVLKKLLEIPSDRLQTGLQHAIEQKIIPNRANLNKVIKNQIERLQIRHGILTVQQFAGKLVDGQTSEPLAGLIVQAFLLDSDKEPRTLGRRKSNKNGLFTLNYLSPADATATNQPKPRFRIKVLTNATNKETFKIDIESSPGEMPVEVRVPAPTLIPDLGDHKERNRPAEEEAITRAQNAFLNNVQFGKAANQTNRLVGTSSNILRNNCACEECDSAVSPIAYLADLLKFTESNVKLNGTPVTVAKLSSAFSQPFNLPADCGTINTPIKQVRICSEILRRMFSPGNLPEKKYVLTVYTSFLTRIGTSFSEIRLARNSPQAIRQLLANRLGIMVNHIDELFLDPEAVPAVLTETRLETLFGYASTTRDPLTPITSSAFQTWRMEWLHQNWKNEDLSISNHDSIPSIDPDLIGPDDFRRPFFPGGHGGRDIILLWKKRRQWVDDRLQQLAAMTHQAKVDETLMQVPDITAMFNAMYQPARYDNTSFVAWAGTTPVTSLEKLYNDLRNGISSEAINARLLADLRLTGDAFIRLMSIAGKDNSQEKVQDEEWQEVYSILVQAQKMRLSRIWRQEEEDEENIEGNFWSPASAQFFWHSLREPEEGVWPPMIQAGQPMIDPEIVKLVDLPESFAGEVSIPIWKARQVRLTEISKELAIAYQQEGFSELLKQALGHPNPGDELQHDLTMLKTALESADPKVADGAIMKITRDLHLSVDNFNRLLAFKNNPVERDTSTICSILTTARKIKHEFSAWIAEEQDPHNNLAYWNVWKAKLPKWRASVEARKTWRQAVWAASQPPVIDPDLLGPDDFKNWDPAENPAITRWKNRKNRINQLLTWIQEKPNTLAGLDLNLQLVIGVTVPELLAIATDQEKGKNITGRLTQLLLDFKAFNYLIRVCRLATDGQPILPSEWENVHSILVQVMKRREFFWSHKNVSDNFFLSPQFFQIAPPVPTPFPPKEPSVVEIWRAPKLAYLEWQNKLRSRIEQEQSVMQALREAVSAAEAAALPYLRDALIRAIPIPGDEEARARWVADNLLVDARMSGDSTTTYVAQAIETLQSFLFKLRTGQIRKLPASPLAEPEHQILTLTADHFDEEWNWIGSYESWRSAMFAFLYPENLLQPGLRREEQQTAAFKAMLNNTRSTRKFTVVEAKQEADRYAQYFQDIGYLDVKASCIHLHQMFLFGITGDRIYWSTFDLRESSGGRHAQTIWAPIAGSGQMINEWHHIVGIVGASIYRVGNTAWLFLFVKRSIDNIDSLLFIKYDIAAREWTREAKVLTLDLPVNLSGRSGFIQAVLKQQDQGEQPHLAIQVRDASDVAWYFERRLNPEGTDWESGGFRKFGTNTAFQDLLGMTADQEGFVYIFKGAADTMSFDIYSYHPHSDNDRLRLKQSHSAIPFYYGGSFSLPGSIYLYMVGDSNAVSTIFRYSLIDTFSGLMEMEVPFGYGLTTVVPVSLSGPLNPGTPRTLAYRIYDMISNRFKTMLAGTFESSENPDTLFVPEISFFVKPAIFEGGYGVPLQLNRDGEARKAMIKSQFENNADGPAVNLVYLQEAYYFVPMHLALTLQKSGEFVAALDLYRTVYDYTEEESARKIYYGLVMEESLKETYIHAPNWLSDPLNPHLIASTRQYAYTRFTLFSIIRCLLEFADAEFTQDTTESNNRARQLYLKALQLFDTAELQQSSDPCIEALLPLKDIPVHDDQRPEVIRRLRLELQTIPDPETVKQTIHEIKMALLTEAPFVEQLEKVGSILNKRKKPPAARLTTILEKTSNGSLVTPDTKEPSLSAALHSISNFAKEDFQHTNSVTSVVHKNEAGILVGSGSRIQGGYLPRLMAEMCMPVNPVIKTLRMRAELNLTKLRTSRNIAGLKRQLEPYSAGFNTNGFPTVSTAGQLQVAGVVKLPPSLYRYQVLIERAKQMIQLTIQMEAGFLSAIEKRDNEAYTKAFSLLKARQELGLAHAGIQLQNVRLTEAIDGVMLSVLQQTRAQVQIDHYQNLLAADVSHKEQLALDLLENAAKDLNESSDLQTGATVATGVSGIISGIAAGASSGGVFGAIAGGIMGAIQSTGPVLSGASSVAGTNSAKKSMQATILSTRASYERRSQEWVLNMRLATQELAIGGQQIVVSNDRVEIVNQERVIAELQASNAKDTIEFLNTQKFTNADLYDWMSNLLESVYRFFLQQTTAIAKIAESQLAFERQEVPPAFIQGDYWNASTDGTTSVEPGNVPVDRRGLTGSARLLQDIYRLDDYAFNTNKRKLQLSKTLSLALLAPTEFQQFRDSGVLLFATPMELFDRDFPGHYLRLIRRVRVSVIALIPPTQGIRATLSTTGLSRVVIGPDIYQTVPILREPEFVALTSPVNATGLFELEPPSADMLLPFEGNGVDTTWEFQLARASNPFDYRTIADVLITIEYTALNSFDYRRQVLNELNPVVSAERSFSFRYQFPDQWYDLHNPDQSTTPMVVNIETIREDFPFNMADLKIQHVLLYFVRNEGQSFEVPVEYFRYAAAKDGALVGGGATTIDGIISTRRGNAGSWTTMIGKSPEGVWELALHDTEEVRSWFGDHQNNKGIRDILFVITYSGKTPEWPV